MTVSPRGSPPVRWARRKGRPLLTTKFWARRLPILSFLRGYDARALLHDVIAGLTVALTVIPQCMGSAVVAGLPPQYGLYSSFMGSFVYLFLGSCKDVTIGPTVITAMLTRPFVDKFGPDIAVTICFFSGCIVGLMGLLQLGFVVDFISSPVLEGFMSAAALSIASSQIPPLLGVPGGGATFLEYWREIVRHVHQTRLWDTVLGVACMAVLLTLRYINKYSIVADHKKSSMSTREKVFRVVLKYLSLSRNAIVVIVTTAIVAGLTGDGEPPVGIAGEIEEGLPPFRPPPFEVVYQNTTLSFGEAVSEMSSAFIIPLILLLESIAVAKTFAKGKSIDAIQEMIALGLSNILGSFFQSFAVTGSFSRSAINNASGVRTPIGGLFTGSLVLLTLVLLTSTLKYLPKASLAAVIICAVVFMIEIHEITITLWRSKRIDLIPLYVTFISCLLIGLDYGMLTGIGVNLVLILYQVARPKVLVENMKVSGRSVLLVTPDRSVTYPAAEHVKSAICKAAVRAGDGLLVVVSGHHVNHVDSTAVKVLKSLVEDMRVRGQEIVMWNWEPSVVRTFEGYAKKREECFRSGGSLEQLLGDQFGR